MRVLTIYAHHNPRSLCHALLERFDAGLRASGHGHEIVDLHGIGFDPVLRDRDGPNWIDDSVPHALAFICPLYFVGFPAILKGWIERVFVRGRDF